MTTLLDQDRCSTTRCVERVPSWVLGRVASAGMQAVARNAPTPKRRCAFAAAAIAPLDAI